MMYIYPDLDHRMIIPDVCRDDLLLVVNAL